MQKDELYAILKKAAELKASDIHFGVGEVPVFRIDGDVLKTKLNPLTEQDSIEIINLTAPELVKDKVLSQHDSDYQFEIKGLSRFRVNVALSFGCHSITIRLISNDIPTFEELKLPSKVSDFASFENGIVLVTGVTGSGKSTTIASILEYINSTKKRHIVTIEDPIEYVYKNKKSIFTQRQVGIDTDGFLSGLKFALRQDPDVILIGEIRDAETVKSALHAAETGHLVFATLHTYNAIQTINRVLSFFEPIEREVVRRQFAEVFRGSLSQKLLPHASGHGRIVATEILVSTPTVKDFIIKDQLEEIYKLVQKGSYNDMRTFNYSLYSLLKANQITQETAVEYSDSPSELIRMIKGAY